MTRPSILAVIPARFASTRFPGKPLALIAGRPMIEWVHAATVACDDVTAAVIATDDERIRTAAEKFEAQVVMTGTHHETGTDRIGEVVESLTEYDVVVNVQGDQPFVTPSILSRLVAPFLAADSPEMATIACPLPLEGAADANCVKVLCDQQMNAIYFSRCDIPFRHDDMNVEIPVYHHLGLYAFSKSFLFTFRDYHPTPLEKCERLEQLRAIENGHQIRVTLVDEPIVEVNTPSDLEVANRAMERRQHGF